MKVHHIGYLVKNISCAMDEFVKLGYEIETESSWDEIRRVHIVFLIKDGYRVELIEPGTDSRIKGLLKRYKNSPYHICYETPDFDKVVSDFVSSGYVLFSEPCKAPCINHKRVCFLMNGEIGMIELLEE